jgi:hypothetical protein
MLLDSTDFAGVPYAAFAGWPVRKTKRGEELFVRNDLGIARNGYANVATSQGHHELSTASKRGFTSNPINAGSYPVASSG